MSATPTAADATTTFTRRTAVVISIRDCQAASRRRGNVTAAPSSNQTAFRTAVIALRRRRAIAQRSNDVSARGCRAQSAVSANAEMKKTALLFETVGVPHSETNSRRGALTNIVW